MPASRSVARCRETTDTSVGQHSVSCDTVQLPRQPQSRVSRARRLGSHRALKNLGAPRPSNPVPHPGPASDLRLRTCVIMQVYYVQEAWSSLRGFDLPRGSWGRRGGRLPTGCGRAGTRYSPFPSVRRWDAPRRGRGDKSRVLRFLGELFVVLLYELAITARETLPQRLEDAIPFAGRHGPPHFPRIRPARRA